MFNIHLFENCSTIISDDYIPHRIYKHLIHPLRTKSSSNCVCYCLCCCNIVALSSSPSASSSTFLQYVDWLLTGLLHRLKPLGCGSGDSARRLKTTDEKSILSKALLFQPLLTIMLPLLHGPTIW